MPRPEALSRPPPRDLGHSDRLYARAPDALRLAQPFTTELLRLAADHFAGEHQRVLANPHHEPQVPRSRRGHARDAAVLMAFQPGVDDELELLLTVRQSGLRFAGHLSFAGGHRDASDESAVHTAVREAEEEIGLRPTAVDVLGAMPPYYSHAGHRIVGVIALVAREATFSLSAHEVARLVRVPAAQLFDPRAYRLQRRSAQPYRANYQWRGHEAGAHGAPVALGGPTLSLLIHLFDAVVRTAN